MDGVTVVVLLLAAGGIISLLLAFTATDPLTKARLRMVGHTLIAFEVGVVLLTTEPVLGIGFVLLLIVLGIFMLGCAAMQAITAFELSKAKQAEDSKQE